MTISVLMFVCILACEDHMDIEHWSTSHMKYINAHSSHSCTNRLDMNFKPWPGPADHGVCDLISQSASVYTLLDVHVNNKTPLNPMGPV